MKCPNTENLPVKLWSMRTTSSVKLVGEFVTTDEGRLPLASTVLDAAKIPAFSKAVELGEIMQAGIVLLGKGAP